MEVQSAPSFGLPAGFVVPYAGATAPAGWLMCQGQNVSRTTYAALFAAIGTTHGVGDGSTTFGIPDGQDRVIAGFRASGVAKLTTTYSASGGMTSLALGGSGGEEAHQQTLTEVAGHVHALHNFNADTGSGDVAVQRFTVAVADVVNTAGYVIAAGGDGPHNNVQPTLVLNHCISTGGP